MSFPNKEDRKKCWDSRDQYWECLDTNENKSKQNTEEVQACKAFRKLFESNCPAQWVTHFDRKRSYLQFKQRIEKEGYEPLDNKNHNKS
ncbi:cytochrome c oxidase assembly factor 6 homolog [Ctenocephalides felis]|uniref:cytochrome c oxidase assembly factor 6 homolog n=1 Tax=Ctenocephalides felis TaxID=7515 RepID=UPI000E6E3BC2|nr:cytochrome c oxidase assembly factor 6 homolog [Ctenocephalides felis]